MAGLLAKVKILPGGIGRRCLGFSVAPRRQDLATLNEADVNAFVGIVGGEGAVQDPDDLVAYNKDWLHKYSGRATLALRPNTTEQVSRVLRYCNDRRIAVVPQGGNTGLVGGSVPAYDEVVLSMSRMDRVIDVDAHAGVLVAEAGCILEKLDRHLAEFGLTMPLDLGAKGSCQIGGNVSTNAGGLRYLRYGSLRGSVLGLEMVLPDGTIVDNLSCLRKDNTGYDLKQLFIGGEGTLGVVTKVAMHVPQRPTSVQLAFIAVNSYDDVLDTMHRAKASLGEILSALEFQDRESLDAVLHHIPSSRDPLSSSFPFYMIVETSGFCEEHDKMRLNKFLEEAILDGVVQDGTIAQDTVQAQQLWELRESIAASLNAVGGVYKYDVSIPVEQMYSLVTKMKQRLDGIVESRYVTGYGHLGDSNLHLNVAVPSFTDEISSRIEPFVYEMTRQLRGSISAEHGLGIMKGEHMHYSKSDAMIDLMHQVKATFDPNGIMNPYKYLPSRPGISLNQAVAQSEPVAV